MRGWSRRSSLGIIVLMLAAVGLSAVADARAQSSTAASTIEPTQPRASLIEALGEFKTGSENLLRLQEAEITKATEKLEQLRRLVAEGLVAKNELQQSEEALSTIQKRLETTRQQIADSDRMIAEFQAAEGLARTQAATKLVAKTRSYLTPTILRYHGSTNWSVSNLAGIQGFFSSKLGRSLPTSAVGQSEAHNRLGFDHRHAVDVALHPDSVEGKALISYLQSLGIPYLAFRSAFPGLQPVPTFISGRPRIGSLKGCGKTKGSSYQASRSNPWSTPKGRFSLSNAYFAPILSNLCLQKPFVTETSTAVSY